MIEALQQHPVPRRSRRTMNIRRGKRQRSLKMLPPLSLLLLVSSAKYADAFALPATRYQRHLVRTTPPLPMNGKTSGALRALMMPTSFRRLPPSRNASSMSVDGGFQWEDVQTAPARVSHHHNHMSALDKVVIAGSSVAGLMAFIGLVSASGPGAWRYYLAGGICAALSHAIPTPIDVVKTRRQVDPSLQSKNLIQATAKIIRTEGYGALLAGLGPTTWGYLIEGSIKFGVYEVLKPTVQRLLAAMAIDSRALAFMLSGTAAGVAASTMLCPMEAIRIRVVAQPDFAPGGWVQAGYKMLKYEGIRGLSKGMGPMLFKQVPYTVTKNVCFDFLTKFAYIVVRRRGHEASAMLKFLIPLLSAVLVSMASCITSQPGDLILSLVNAHEGNKQSKDFIQDILESESGIRGFFVGMKARFLHVGIVVTLQLLIYDFVKRLCGIAATGAV